MSDQDYENTISKLDDRIEELERLNDELQRKLDTAYEIIDKNDDMGDTIRNLLDMITFLQRKESVDAS